MFVWIIAIFLWMYLIPLLMIGLVVCFPIFVFVVPTVVAMGCVQYLFTKEHLSKINYSLWFGVAPKIKLENKYLVCFHPHGVLCTAAVICIHLHNNTKFAVAPILLHMPVVGLFVKSLGCIEATEIAICNALKTHSVILCPGGIEELVTQRLYTRRHGFLRIAQKMSVPILPCICHTQFYDHINMPFEALRLKFAKWGIPIMFPPLGWYGTWLPKRRAIDVEIKKPFVVKGDIEVNRKHYFNLIKI